MKYIVESIGVFRMIHVVEAPDETEAFAVARVADDNWQEHLGEMKVDIQPYTEEHIKRFKEKQFFWEGTAYRAENGTVGYLHPTGARVEPNDTLVR